MCTRRFPPNHQSHPETRSFIYILYTVHSPLHNAPLLEAKVHKRRAVDAGARQVEDFRLEEHHGPLREVKHAAGLRAVPALAPVLEGLDALGLGEPFCFLFFGVWEGLGFGWVGRMMMMMMMMRCIVVFIFLGVE